MYESEVMIVMASKKSVAKNSDMKMKVIVFAALIIAFIGGYLVARAKYKPQIMILNSMVSEKDDAMQKMKANANRVLMKDGEMWVVEEGMVRLMDSDVVMPNGTKVMQDGKVVTSDGEEIMMQNGDAMTMDGKMMPNGGTDVDTSSPTF